MITLEKVINEEMKKLSEWLKLNRLALNISKTNFLIFNTDRRKLSHNVTLKLDKKAITEKQSIKYLGVIVDHHLMWKDHILTIS